MSGNIAFIAKSNGYSDADIAAGVEFFKRKNRKTNPPGEFDDKKRFYASERTRSVLTCRAPSARWPFSEMKAARTADHCAEVFGAKSLHVKRIARAMEIERDTFPGGNVSAHELVQFADSVKTVLKKVAA